MTIEDGTRGAHAEPFTPGVVEPQRVLSCDNCGSTRDVLHIPDPECSGVHAWNGCAACRGVAEARTGPEFPDDAQTIIRWSQGRWVRTADLVAELRIWLAHFEDKVQ